MGNKRKKLSIILLKFISFFLYYTALWHIIKFLNRKKLKILLYHDVSDKLDNHLKKLNISTSIGDFKNHLEFIQKHYRIENFNDIEKLLPYSVIITFDDGLHSFYENAFPILKERRITTYVFLITDSSFGDYVMWCHKLSYLQCAEESKNLNDFSLNKFEKVKQKVRNSISAEIDEEIDGLYHTVAQKEGHELYLNPERISELSSTHYVYFGTHTRRHYFVNTNDNFIDDIMVSKSLMKNENINFVNILSIPFGEINARKCVLLLKKFDYILLADNRHNSKRNIQKRMLSRILLRAKRNYEIFYEMELLPLIKSIFDLNYHFKFEHYKKH